LDAITKWIFSTAALVLCLVQCAVPACFGPQDLHEQATEALLDREFSGPDLAYLLLNENGRVVAQRWEHPELDAPIGSLVKPFLAAAYGKTHATFPRFRCIGKKTCWLVRGHGTLQIRDAIAYSCNSYFHQLVANAGPDFAQALNAYALHDSRFQGNDLAQATAAPLALSRAYLELTHHPRDAAVLPVLQGMALSAQKGTGKAVSTALPHVAVLAKTGTAPCIHAKKAAGDGFAMVMSPADHPREILLVRLHGRPGAIAAGVAGRMIAAVEGIENK
jgi:cell division protein FtsI/penicillin-binding protein 2